jgi:hypothetical protein
MRRDEFLTLMPLGALLQLMGPGFWSKRTSGLPAAPRNVTAESADECEVNIYWTASD